MDVKLTATKNVWWDSVVDYISDSEDSGNSGSSHSGGIWKFDISKESSHDSTDAEEESRTKDDGEDTTDRSSFNSKANSSLKEHIHSKDGEEWYQKEGDKGEEHWRSSHR